MLENGFVQLHRSILDWEWYGDINTTRLFIHLLLTANYEPKPWKGITIDRGQRVASYGKLAEETGLSIKQIRASIRHLKRTGEVAHTATSKYCLFTVKNYDRYQTQGTQTGSQVGTQMGSQRAVKGQQCNKDNKAIKKKYNIIGGKSPIAQPQKFQKPTLEEVQAYCRERGNAISPERFMDYYESNGWRVGKSQMKDWKAAIRNWERRNNQEANQQLECLGYGKGAVRL